MSSDNREIRILSQISGVGIGDLVAEISGASNIDLTHLDFPLPAPIEGLSASIVSSHSRSPSFAIKISGGSTSRTLTSNVAAKMIVMASDSQALYGRVGFTGVAAGEGFGAGDDVFDRDGSTAALRFSGTILALDGPGAACADFGVGAGDALVGTEVDRSLEAAEGGLLAGVEDEGPASASGSAGGGVGVDTGGAPNRASRFSRNCFGQHNRRFRTHLLRIGELVLVSHVVGGYTVAKEKCNEG